jgi:hypothetical protein
MRRRCPLWVSILIASSGAFSSRRRVVRLWSWTIGHPLLIALRTAWFWTRNPVLFFRVRLLARRMRALHAEGLGLLSVSSGMVL